MSAQELGSKKWEELFAVQLLITSYIRKCHCKKIAILTLHSVCKHVLGQTLARQHSLTHYAALISLVYRHRG